MRFRANLVQRNYEKPPQLVFFGGSRSQRFDPTFARQRLRLRSVNISQSNARPESAWSYLNWFSCRWPDANVRWAWGMQDGMLRDRDLDPDLLQDRRFSRYFPDDLLASQRKRLPDSVAEMPRAHGYTRDRCSSEGMLLWNTYDSRRAKGYTLSRSLDAYIAKMLRQPRAATGPDTRAGVYFEQTIQLLDDHGTTPVLVLMPIHPRVLRVMKAHDMCGSREALRRYFAELGESGWLYDGVPITRRNSNLLIAALRARAGECLK